MILRLFALILLLFCAKTLSQATSLDEQRIMVKEAAENKSIPLEQYVNVSSNSRGDLPYSNQNVLSDNAAIRPFGYSLFSTSARGGVRAAINPQYIVSSGDKISVQLWGAVNVADVYTVDNQGNIFITNVGPISLRGTLAANINTIVRDAIKKIYTDNVSIYVNLLATTPVSVFVTGPVVKPGQYAGASADSIFYYLQLAGGIDDIRGSYRNIEIIRGGKTQQKVDLYDFLVDGRVITHSFQDGDVILVSQRGPSVIVEESGKPSMAFELRNNGFNNGKALRDLAMPDSKVSHVSITGTRNLEPISVYLPIAEFDDFKLVGGDTVLFNDDIRPQVISVKISGSYYGPSFYTVNSDAKLHDLLSQISVDPKQANTDSIYLLRESVKLEQKQLLEASLARLERSVFTAPASSDGEARIRAQEAEMVAQFIARARQVEPLGKVVVALDNEVSNIRLEQGDEIVIPQYSDLLNVSGEVLLPQALVYSNDALLSNYINWAGGFTDRANKEEAILIHANGATSIVSIESNAWFSGDEQVKLQPGDQILILPKVDNKVMQSVKDVVQILYQIAIIANVATD